MLCLSRLEGERVVVRTAAGDVWIEVLVARGGKLRVGITAPLSMVIQREEHLPPGERFGAARGAGGRHEVARAPGDEARESGHPAGAD